MEGCFGISMRLWVGNDHVWMNIGNGKGVRGLFETFTRLHVRRSRAMQDVQLCWYRELFTHGLLP